MIQGSVEWHKERIGMITSSEIGKIFKKGRSKDEIFGTQAISYINKKISERLISNDFIENEDYLLSYLERVKISGKALEYGTAFESSARQVYEEKTGFFVKETGFIKVDENFGDSPDGLVVDENGEIIGTVEIKCPYNPENHFSFLMCENEEDLRKENEDYFYQCHGHIYANNVKWCDFISFDYMSKYPLKIIRVNRDENIIKEIKERIELAVKIIDENIFKILIQ